jgi:hypothetical protein
VKLFKRILFGLGIAALLAHSIYLTARVHDLDDRLRATYLLINQSRNGELRISTTGPLAPETLPAQRPVEERLRRLEEDLHPKMRLLGEK